MGDVSGSHSMALRVSIYEIKVEGDRPLYVGSLDFPPTDTLQVLRGQMEVVDLLGYPFDFWEIPTGTRIRTRLETLKVLEPEVYVVPRILEEEEPPAKQPCVEEDLPLHDGAWIDDLESGPGSNQIDASTDVVCEDEPTAVEKHPILKKHELESVLLDSEIVERYMKAALKLEEDMLNQSCDDHLWHLKSWDERGKAYIKIWCGECKKLLGTLDNSHSPLGISNCMGNFRNKHIWRGTHLRAYCSRNDIEYDTHPLSDKKSAKKTLQMTPEAHKRLLIEGLAILKKVNDNCTVGRNPFVLVGNPDIEPCRSWLYKSKCTYFHNLCPKKNNLEANLMQHIEGNKHHGKVAKIDEVKSREGISTGKRGRPAVKDSSKSSTQRDLHTWLVPKPTTSSRTGLSHTTGGASSSGQQRPLHFLCWGFWRMSVSYGGKLYVISGLLHDQKMGGKWIAEPETSAKLDLNGKSVHIHGCFRHVECFRVTRVGVEFPDLTCELCARIPQENDFQKRVMREDEALEKRGTRSTGKGRRLGYLWHSELVKHTRLLKSELRVEKVLHWTNKQRVCLLKRKKPTLKEAIAECLNQKDILKFCNNIIQAYRANAFGGKPALWDFLTDVARNLNAKSSKGNRFSSNSMAFAQTLKLYGGKRMTDFVSLNFATPSLSSVKRVNKKGVNIIVGEHVEIFQYLAFIYTQAKLAHNIHGDVPVLLAEDETKIKSAIRWSAKDDTLSGFCGLKADHRCDTSFVITVGSDRAGYDNIVEAFRTGQRGSYARVIMVNPLHSALPRLALVVCCTCNKFKAEWVLSQWQKIERMWNKDLRKALGPIVAHSSDGDSRRRNLQVHGYKVPKALDLSYRVPWEGWSYWSICKNELGEFSGLGDQDFPHNDKKLVGALESAIRTLHFGSDVATINHIKMVFNKFSQDEHGLKLVDIERKDRQNLASAQRIASRKVQHCLSLLRNLNDRHQERTLSTQSYLEICGDYNDIFLSPRADLRSRLVLAAKVSFFLRLWKLWLKFGDKTVGGNTKTLTEKESFISNQCFMDIQISCHFVVFLCIHFRNHYPHLPVPLHLTGSDCCEIFFSKLGGMVGVERSYDIGDLLQGTKTINDLANIEYGENGIKFDKQHNKMKNVWAELHPLLEGETPANLGDYSSISSDTEVVDALKEGLREAQNLLHSCNASPSRYAANPRWWTSPWLVERETPHPWFEGAALAKARPVVGDDDDALDDDEESLNENIENDMESEDVEGTNSEETLVTLSDGLSDLNVFQNEVGHILTEILEVPSLQQNENKISQTVEYAGSMIYKSTLVSQLNSTPFLSKDRLTRVKDSILFNNSEDYMDAANAVNTCMLGLGSDCAVFYEKPEITSSTVNASRTRSRNKSVMTSGQPKQTSQGSERGTFWLGRVQKIKRRKNGKSWGECRNSIDLLKKPPQFKKDEPSVLVMLNFFSRVRSSLKFKYDVTDAVWLDIETIISTVTLAYDPNTRLYTLSPEDAEPLNEFVGNQC